MNEWEQLWVENHTPWEKGAPSPPLLHWLEKNPGVLGGRILVPGCGTGHDVRAITAAVPDAEVIGIDISKTAIKRADEDYPKVGNEAYRKGDFFDPPETMLDSFDWIWEHTCFCAIDPGRRDDYVKAAWTALNSDVDSQLLAVFFLDPYDEEHRPGEGPPHGTSIEELVERFEGSGRFEILDQYVPTVAYPEREGCEYVMRMRGK